jgi:endoglucanase
MVVASNKAGSGAARSRATAIVTANTAPPAPPPPPPPPGPPPGAGLHVSGNHLLNGNNQVVSLHGVNRAGTEYACVQGWGIFDGPADEASINAIASWHSNVVHLGLNETCVLGINGVNPAYSGANYMNAITSYVNALHAHGLYAEISMMWAAPGNQQAHGHPPILDADHAPAAWQAIANAFRNDPNTFFGLQSEPHDISWACWKNGGSSCSVGYAALGMQGALDAIRSTGATNVVTASGIDWANNISQWLTYRPTDQLNQFMAEAHVYGNNTCSSNSCLDSEMAPVAAAVPLVFGETGETYDDSSCGSANISRLMGWADAHGVGYEAWVWDTWGTCGSLIADYNGTPANAYGTWVRNHYLGF